MHNNWLRNYRQACVLQHSATATPTKVHNPLHRFDISYKPSVQAWREQTVTLRYLWIQDVQQAGEVDIKRVATHENPADIYTKLLPAHTLQSIYLKMVF